MNTSTAPPTPSPDFSDLFQLAPVSLWLEDYQAVRELFGQWRAQGVVDLRSYLRAEPARVAQCSACIRVLQVNRRTLSLFEAELHTHLVDNLPRIFRDDMFQQHVEELVQLWNGQGGFEGQSVNYTLGGRRLDVLLRATVLPGHEEDWSRVLVSLEDITERSSAQRALREAEQYARGLFEHSPVSLWVEDFSAVRDLLDEVRQAGVTDFRTFIDVHPEFVERCMKEIRVIDVNQQTLQLFHAPDKATMLRRLDEIFRDDMQVHFAEQLTDLWNGKTAQQREQVNYALDGEPVHVQMQFSVLPGHESRWDLVLVSLTDITARKKAEAYLEYLGKHDTLTKLRNRSFFADEVQRLQRRGPMPVTVLILDLNGLKLANDGHGHAVGDSLLRRAGEVLAKAVDQPMCVARIGGDEFAVLMPASEAAAGEALAERIAEMVEVNNQYYGKPVLDFSVGAATCPAGGLLEEAISRADRDMYEVKRRYYLTQGRDRRARG